ncbi:MAG: phage terminase small subunit P27 family [Pseudomonadota bacterium]|nr:phage terminase small subunit P27 family [Pseudomonadota bacterium]
MTDDTDATPIDGEILGSAPAWLDDAGRETWEALTADLRNRNMLRDAETVAFARYCDYVSLWRDLRGKVREIGATVTSISKHGQLDRVSPQLKAMLAIEGALVALEDRYGMTPAARYRIMTMKANVQGDLPLSGGRGEAPQKPQGPSPDDRVVSFPGVGSVAVRK